MPLYATGKLIMCRSWMTLGLVTLQWLNCTNFVSQVWDVLHHGFPLFKSIIFLTPAKWRVTPCCHTIDERDLAASKTLNQIKEGWSNKVNNRICLSTDEVALADQRSPHPAPLDPDYCTSAALILKDHLNSLLHRKAQTEVSVPVIVLSTCESLFRPAAASAVTRSSKSGIVHFLIF